MAWSTRTIPTTSWGNRSVPSTSWDLQRQPAFLLQESLSFLLLESGYKIQLDQYGINEANWSTRVIPT